jgi:hypothetical protein
VDDFAVLSFLFLILCYHQGREVGVLGTGGYWVLEFMRTSSHFVFSYFLFCTIMENVKRLHWRW